MDKTQDHYAYRCLPLTIANMLGYHIFLKNQVRAVWDGGVQPNSIKILEDANGAASSIFGHGILTFHVDWLVKTDENVNTFITGPFNHVVENVQALTGVYETDWAPFSFTMNWQFLTPGECKFTVKDPICHLFPFPRDYIESVPIAIRPISDDASLEKDYKDFDASRLEFLSKQERQGWQKNYFKGLYTDGTKCPIENHQTKINLPEINDETRKT